MRIVVNPFETAPGTAPAYGRQIAYLIGEVLNTLDGVEVVTDASDQNEGDTVIGGRVELEGSLTLEVAVATPSPSPPRGYEKVRADATGVVQQAMAELPEVLGLTPTEAFVKASSDLGTDDSEAFLLLLLGWDALAQVLRLGRDIPSDFDFEGAFDALVSSLQRDPDFLAPFEAMLALARQCGELGIGDAEVVERSLQKATLICPDDWRGWYMLGDVLQRTGRPADAEAAYEKSLGLNAGEAAVWVRLGLMQLAQQKTGQAERSFREALGREDDSEEKTAAPYLATLLVQQDRAQEAQHLWEELRERGPMVAGNWLNLAAAQEHGGDVAGARHTLDQALETVEDKALIQRNYAAYLGRQGDYAGALRLYEVAVPYMPYDSQLMVEYAQCLQANGRTEDLIKILGTILDSSPPADLRAQANAWRMEVEQPSKLERFQMLGQRLMEGDKASALAEMEQLAAWLGDYWKIWLAMAHGYNEIGESERAERAAIRLLEMFPGCEPAYGELAGALFRQGKAEFAYQGLRRALRIYPQYITIAGNLGMAAKLTGRLDEARQVREALRPLVDRTPGLSGLIEALSETPQTDPPR